MGITPRISENNFNAFYEVQVLRHRWGFAAILYLPFVRGKDGSWAVASDIHLRPPQEESRRWKSADRFLGTQSNHSISGHIHIELPLTLRLLECYHQW